MKSFSHPFRKLLDVLFTLLISQLSISAAHAQNTIYTNGENNTSALSSTGNITLTIASGAATQSGPISGSGQVIVNSSSADTGTLTLTATNTYTGYTVIDFGTLAVTGTGASTTTNNSFNLVGCYSGDNAALTISNGGQFSDNYAELGTIAGSKGTAFCGPTADSANFIG